MRSYGNKMLRPSVRKAGQAVIEVMKATAWDNDLETFKKVLRAWDVVEGSAEETKCLEAWHLKREEMDRLRRASPRRSPR